ncbi:MAG: hypothetical protein N3A55_09530 [Methylohalobius sp.]|nr:hypothetical protein [Methylohalobius sp.]
MVWQGSDQWASMLQAVLQFIMTWLDPIGVVVGLILAVPVFWTWYEVIFGERRRRRRWFEEVRWHVGARPAILIVDLLPGKDICASVERFRMSQEELRDIPKDRIFVLSREELLRVEAMPELHQALQRIVARLLACGADQVHYFHAGPAVIAALIGAELANGPQILVYHHQNGTYQNFGPLRLRL